MKSRIVIFIIVLFCSSWLQAQEVSVDLDSAQIMIGDQVHLNLRASYPVGSKVQFPDPGSIDFGDIELIRIGSIDTLKSEPEIHTQQRLLISAYDSGYYQIPELLFSFILPDGSQFNTLSENLELEVAIPQVDTTAQIAPIKGILKEGFKFSDAIPFLALFGAILASVLLGLFLYRRFTAPEVEFEPPPVVIPAYVTAYKKLDKLKEEKHWQKGEIKKYHSQLTFVLREYLENQFHFRALESTTEDILSHLKEVNISGDWKIRLRELLQIADLVKFAKAKPGPEFHEKALDDAYLFVDYTRKFSKSSEEEEETESQETEILNESDESNDGL